MPHRKALRVRLGLNPLRLIDDEQTASDGTRRHQTASNGIKRHQTHGAGTRPRMQMPLSPIGFVNASEREEKCKMDEKLRRLNAEFSDGRRLSSLRRVSIRNERWRLHTTEENRRRGDGPYGKFMNPLMRLKSPGRSLGHSRSRPSTGMTRDPSALSDFSPLLFSQSNIPKKNRRLLKGETAHF